MPRRRPAGARGLDLLPAWAGHQLVELGAGRGHRALGDLVAGRGVVAGLLGGGASFGEALQPVEVAAGRVELRLSLGELVFGRRRSSARVPASSNLSCASAASASARA